MGRRVKHFSKKKCFGVWGGGRVLWKEKKGDGRKSFTLKNGEASWKGGVLKTKSPRFEKVSKGGGEDML